ncbi:MAG: hypothetical protein ACI8YQ_003328 [Polaribacter sp.]|jgi:hypothetical protein
MLEQFYIYRPIPNYPILIKIVSKTDMKCYLSLCAFLFLGWATLPVSSLAQSIPCGTNAPILDNSCTASSNFPITVTGIGGSQLGTDVILQEVRFIIAHTWDNDLDIKLISPSGITIELSTDNGGGADHYGDPSDNTCSNYTSFMMNACIPIENGIAPFIGNHVPEEDFADFNNNSNPNGTWILQICDDAANDVGQLFFVELIFKEMSCPPPTKVAVDTLLGNSVAIEWETGGTCVNALLEYGPLGFTPGTGATANEGTLITLSCPVAQPYLILGLEDLTTYDIYIREECNNGGYSDNSCPLNITTNCNTAPITLLENFDTLVTCPSSCGSTCTITGTWFNSSEGDFDWLVDGGGTGSANTGPADDVSIGGQYIYTEASGSACRNGKKAILESTCLEVDASVGTCHLSFFHHLYGTHINELQLEVSTNGGISWLLIWNIIGNQGDQWERTYIDLSAYNGLLAKFRFVAIGGNGIKGDMAVDEISFYGVTIANGGGTTFYADQDNDSFGDVNNPITVCTQLVPSGYVNNTDDCDDTTASISPMAVEIPCNDIDENCDGVFLQVLPIPVTTDQIICIGTTVTLSVNESPTGDFYWSDMDGNILFIGNNIETSILTETTSYWVQDSVVNICTSPRKMITITIDPGPMIGTNDQPTICIGDVFDLEVLNIIDASNNVNTTTYHSASPASAGNELSSAIVSPQADSVFYLQAETINGCTAELAIPIVVNNNPTALISASNNDLNICANELSTVSGLEGGTGTGEITYLWEDGSTSPDRTIFPSTPPGPFTYLLEVKDENNCVNVDSIVISTLPSISAIGIEAITPVGFCDGNDGAISLIPIDGLAPFTYEWSGPVPGTENNVAGGFTISGLTQGAYKVTISDGSGENCQVFIPNIIVNGPGVIVDAIINITAVTCFGGSDGSIDIEVSGGTPDYNWSNGCITEDLQNVPAGIYSVTIVDGICETVLSDLEISSPTIQETVLATVHQISCGGGADGAIDINNSGGVVPYTYDWSNNENTEDVSGLISGDYQVTITDANSCTTVGPLVNIFAPALLQSSLNNVTAVSCFEGHDGTIEYTASGGTPPYFFQWSNGLLTSTISNLPTGTYQPTITDFKGCTTLGLAVTVGTPAAMGISLDLLKTPDCNEIENGEIELSISGGTAPYTYEWSNNENTEDLSDLAEGEYTLTLTDSKGCTIVSEPYELIAPEVLFFDLVFIQEESCQGVGDGSINVQVLGGTEPYDFQWNTGQETDDIENLSAGMYQLLVTDNNGCTKTSPFLELVALEPLSVTVAEQSDVSCAGQTNGSVYLDVPTLGMPYSYLWNDGSSAPFLEDVSPGNYQARITANNGCIFYSEQITIAEPDSLKVNVASVESPTCNGFFNGSIDVAVNGGTGPFTYSWNNGIQEEDLSGAPAGTYLLTVLDQNGCATSTEAINLTEPNNLLHDYQSTGVGCTDSIGNIAVAISGGTAPYSYTWNTGDSLAILEDLPAGEYSLTTTDANGCILLNSGLAVAQLVDTLEVSIAIDAEISCFNIQDGVLAAEIMGGNFPYQYNWSNGITDSLNQNLGGGNYRVTVTDNYGCVGVSEMTNITTQSPISYFVNEIVGNLCLGDQQGYIMIDVNGGVAPYAVDWNNGVDSAYIDQLPTGNYYLTITDQNGCTAISSQAIVVTGPSSSVQGEIIGSTEVNCFGDTNASISMSPTGGTGDYNISWSTGANESTLNNLGTGLYQCTITDQNSCVYITPIYEIDGPDEALIIPIDSSQVLHNENCEGADGAVEILVLGGTTSYNYLWSNNEITTSLNDLPSGAYYCTVSDDNGCVTEAGPFLVEEPENTLDVAMLSTPDTNDMEDGTATAPVEGGAWPYEFAWDVNTGSQTDSIAIDLQAGFYNITITDANQCIIIEGILVDTITILSDATVNIDQLGTLHYFPNPTSDILQVNIELTKASNIKLRLSTLIGQAVREWAANSILNENVTFDISELPAGPYLLWGEVDGKILVREIVVIE